MNDYGAAARTGKRANRLIVLDRIPNYRSCTPRRPASST